MLFYRYPIIYQAETTPTFEPAAPVVDESGWNQAYDTPVGYRTAQALVGDSSGSLDEIAIIETGWDQSPPPPMGYRIPVYYGTFKYAEEVEIIESGWDESLDPPLGYRIPQALQGDWIGPIEEIVLGGGGDFSNPNVVFDYTIIYQSLSFVDEVEPPAAIEDTFYPAPSIVRSRPVFPQLDISIPFEFPDINSGWDQSYNISRGYIIPHRIYLDLSDYFVEELIADVEIAHWTDPLPVRYKDVYYSDWVGESHEIPIIESGWEMAYDVPLGYTIPKALISDWSGSLETYAIIESGWNESPDPPMGYRLSVYYGDFIIGDEVSEIGTGWDQFYNIPLGYRKPVYYGDWSAIPEEFAIIESGWWWVDPLPLVYRIPEPRIFLDLSDVYTEEEIPIVDIGHWIDPLPIPPIKIQLGDFIIGEEIPPVDMSWYFVTPPPVIRFKDVYYGDVVGAFENIPSIDSGWHYPDPQIVRFISVYLPESTPPATDVAPPVFEDDVLFDPPSLGYRLTAPDSSWVGMLEQPPVIQTGWDQAYNIPTGYRIPKAYLSDWVGAINEISIIQSGWDQAYNIPKGYRLPRALLYDISDIHTEEPISLVEIAQWTDPLPVAAIKIQLSTIVWPEDFPVIQSGWWVDFPFSVPPIKIQIPVTNNIVDEVPVQEDGWWQPAPLPVPPIPPRKYLDISDYFIEEIIPVVDIGWYTDPLPILPLKLQLGTVIISDEFVSPDIFGGSNLWIDPLPVPSLPGRISTWIGVLEPIPIIESGWNQAPPPPLGYFLKVYYPSVVLSAETYPDIGSGWWTDPPPVVLPIKLTSSSFDITSVVLVLILPDVQLTLGIRDLSLNLTTRDLDYILQSRDNSLTLKNIRNT